MKKLCISNEENATVKKLTHFVLGKCIWCILYISFLFGSAFAFAVPPDFLCEQRRECNLDRAERAQYRSEIHFDKCLYYREQLYDLMTEYKIEDRGNSIGLEKDKMEKKMKYLEEKIKFYCADPNRIDKYDEFDRSQQFKEYDEFPDR